MLTLPEVRRYSTRSGLRDMMIAEKEIILTFLLQLLSERGILDRLAFKGGTCLRKMFIGSHGRFSTDLDFTALEEHNHEDVVLAMMGAFEEEFHGIRFQIPGSGYYLSLGGQSWGVNPIYSHDWNGAGDSEVRVQVSLRETPTLTPERRRQCEQSYFGLLPFAPVEITCLALPEILAEKIRACYQRSKARDIYDLGIYATRPLDKALTRRLVVLKLWQAGDTFHPERLMKKFEEGIEFDWDDLRDLVRRTEEIEREKICAACAEGFRFLADLSPEERALANDSHQREQELWDRLRAEVGSG
ncbi:MAG: nucleotidyl transferase AbiEii/AbiGii toxin family protein [Limisphaerales bacterium]